MLKFLYLIPLCFILLYSCKKETPQPEPEPPVVVQPPQDTSLGTLKIGFNHLVDTLPLVFNQDYISPAGDTFKVSKFNYYVSNIVLMNAGNEIFRVPESYHLIQHSVPASTLISLAKIPKGTYTSISFMIGVDSLRNCSGAQTGDLDPTKNMFWSWNTGYIFLKLEGSAPTATTTGKGFTYHVGGFKGPDKTQRTVNLAFTGQGANVKSSAQPVVTLKVNVNEFFKNPKLIYFKTDAYQMSPGPGAKMFADNYSDMFKFDNVKN